MSSHWSAGLPSDLLAVILSGLPLSDFIRSGGVCRSWRRVTAEKYRTSPETPLLMIPGSSDDEYSGKLFSLTEEKVFRFPQIRGKRFLGSYDGWVVILDDLAELHILNPFTGAEADLPSITTFSCVHGVGLHPNNGSVMGYVIKPKYVTTPFLKYLKMMVDHFYLKVIYFPSAKTAVAIISNGDHLAFARIGDDSWTDLKSQDVGDFRDIILHKGQLFAVNSKGVVVSFDLCLAPAITSIMFSPPIPSTRCHYLVETLKGELLHVCRYRSGHHTAYGVETDSFKVFRFESNERVEVTSLGEYTALFVGHNHSASISTRGSQLKGNCIYFTEGEIYDHSWHKSNVRIHMGVFNFQDGSVKPFASNFSLCHLACPPSIWITPTLS